MFRSVVNFAQLTFRRTSAHRPFPADRQSPKMSTEAVSSSASSPLVAICHMRSTHDPQHNRQQVAEIVRQAVAQQARFVFLPECCDFVGRQREETLRLSEPLTGATVQFYRQLARDHRIWLSVGGFHERTAPNDERIHNAHLVISADGELVANYRKLHLFDVDTPEFKFRESAVVEGGHEVVAPLQTPIGPLGLMICYDLRFPELSTLLAKRGAHILTYPSAFAVSTGRAHWEVLLRARAIETQCFVIASAQVGFHNERRESYGHAMVVDPFGRVLAECDSSRDMDVRTVALDMSLLHRVRRNMPCWQHRRPDVYALQALVEWQGGAAGEEGEAVGEAEVAAAAVQGKPFVFEKFEIPAETIFYEGQYSVAFTNIRCVVDGHVLVASRRCVGRLHQLHADEVADLFLTVAKVQRMLDAVHGTSSATVTVQDGELAGQTVRHVHYHVMPRRKGDFAHNDEIYVELDRHDKPQPLADANGSCDGAMKPRRPLAEMSAEAERYRRAMKETR